MSVRAMAELHEAASRGFGATIEPVPGGGFNVVRPGVTLVFCRNSADLTAWLHPGSRKGRPSGKRRTEYDTKRADHGSETDARLMRRIESAHGVAVTKMRRHYPPPGMLEAIEITATRYGAIVRALWIESAEYCDGGEWVDIAPSAPDGEKFRDDTLAAIEWEVIG